MDLLRFILRQHASTHAADLSDARATRFDRLLAGLSESQLRTRPAAGLNSIVWLLWHMARTEDVAVNIVVAARAQVFDEGWARRMNVPEVHMGSGMTAAEVAVLSERADVAAVRAYRSAVGGRTREVVAALAPAAWDEIQGLADTERAAAVGAFGPRDDWIEGVGHRPWQGVSRGDQLGSSAIRHNTAHIGEMVTLRSLLEGPLGI
jgi:hypothetical protein